MTRQGRTAAKQLVSSCLEHPLNPHLPDVGLPPIADRCPRLSPPRMHTTRLLSGFLGHAIGDPLIWNGEQGRFSLETVTSEGCHSKTDHFRLPVSMPCDR